MKSRSALSKMTGELRLFGVLLLLMMAVNMSGTKNLARVAKIGFWCEIVSVIALGIYLLIFHRSQPFSVIFDSMGVLAQESLVRFGVVLALRNYGDQRGEHRVGGHVDQQPPPREARQWQLADLGLERGLEPGDPAGVQLAGDGHLGDPLSGELGGHVQVALNREPEGPAPRVDGAVDQLGHRGEVGLRVIGQGFEDALVGGEKRGWRDHQLVAVGRRARHLGRADLAGSPGLVLDDDGLAQGFFQRFGQRPGRQIRGGARREAHDQVQGLVGPVVGSQDGRSHCCRHHGDSCRNQAAAGQVLQDVRSANRHGRSLLNS